MILKLMTLGLTGFIILAATVLVSIRTSTPFSKGSVRKNLIGSKFSFKEVKSISKELPDTINCRLLIFVSLDCSYCQELLNHLSKNDNFMKSQKKFMIIIISNSLNLAHFNEYGLRELPFCLMKADNNLVQKIETVPTLVYLNSERTVNDVLSGVVDGEDDINFLIEHIYQ